MARRTGPGVWFGVRLLPYGGRSKGRHWWLGGHRSVDGRGKHQVGRTPSIDPGNWEDRTLTLQDRVRGLGRIPRLAELIRRKAEESPARKVLAAPLAEACGGAVG